MYAATDDDKNASPAPGPTVLVCVDLAMVATEKTSKPWLGCPQDPKENK